MVKIPALAGPRLRPRLPRPAIRMRMALSYWGLFVVSGAVLLAATLALWQGETVTTVHVTGRAASPGATVHGSDLGQLLILAGIALAVMAAVSIMFGWLVAGRFLAPVRAITASARRISATSLHERLSLQGPDDELKELADTINGLLARLERSFESERRFAASASHELRTPLATMRVWLDVATAKPGPLPPQTVALAGRIRGELDHVDALLESLLTLARTQQGPADDQTVTALSAAAATAIQRRAGTIAAMPLHVDHRACPDARVAGSDTLLTRMVENVIDNAVRHNRPGGWIRVSTETDRAQARLVVENSGTILTPEDVSQLARPFRRPGTERTGSDSGTGLSLGADDYLPKPFHFPELVLRIRALARRQPAARPRIYRAAGIELDTLRHVAARDRRQLSLSAREFAVLEALMREHPAVLSAEGLLEQAWDEHTDPFSNIVSVTISRLRRKLGEPPVIGTIPNVGYHLMDPSA